MLNLRVSTPWIAGLALFMLPWPAAAGSQFEGLTISGVSVTGLRHIREEVVTAQILSRPGRLYRQVIADADVVRLERLRVFSKITITPEPRGDGVHLDVRLVETVRLLPAVSVMVTDESGLSIGPAVRVLSVHGIPHDITALSRFGGEGLVQVSETSPLLTDRRLWHTAKLAIRNRDNRLDDFDEHSLDADARIGVRGSDTWKAGAIVQFYGVRTDDSGITLSSSNRDRFVGVGATFEHDTRDSWTMPRRGWWNSVDALWHTGTGDYGTLDVDVRRFQPLGPEQTVLATALVTMTSGQHGVDVPTYTDYALGGENTVRGWDFASRRGMNQLIASLEYRRTVLPTRAFKVAGFNFYGGIALAVFGDIGTAWNDTKEFSEHRIAGGGIGLRFFVPFVDMIRFDVSYGSGMHAQIGISEKAVAQRNRVR